MTDIVPSAQPADRAMADRRQAGRILACLSLLSGLAACAALDPASTTALKHSEPAPPVVKGLAADGRIDSRNGITSESPSADGDETIAILWGKFRTHLALPDPDLSLALSETPPPDEPPAAPSRADGRPTPPSPGETTTVPRRVATVSQTLSPDDVGDDADAPSSRSGTPSGDPAGPAREPDLWDRIRQGFRLPVTRNERVRREADWYARHQQYLDRTVERARPYLHLIVSAIDKRGLPMEIALLPIVESAFQPFAYSHGRAAGLWQFIPGTARRFGLEQNWWYDGRRDILASTNAALDYLQGLNREFRGDWELALAAYNSGAGTVRKAILYNRRRHRPADFWHLRLPRETRAYVPKLLALRALVADPKAHGIHLASIPDRPYLTTAEIGSQIDLALAADLAGLSLEEIYRLNPGFNHWATAPEGPHRLLIPVDRLARFEQGLARLPPEERIQWKRHRIRPGETLGHIARRYRTTVRVLKQVNKIRGHMIRAGDNLIIPVATRDIGRYTLSAEQRHKRLISRAPAGTLRKTIHRVRKGDTFWDLARRYHTSVRTLARWNGLSPRDILRPGQRLVVWQRTASPGRSHAGTIPLAAPSRRNTTRRILYIVKKGDSLARISQRFRVRISQLRHWNDLPKGRYLQPGQRLTLYIDVTRQTENI